MKVLHVLPGADPTGGAEQSFASTARLLADDGFELHLAVLTTRQDLVPRLQADGVAIHDLSGVTGRRAHAAAIHGLLRQLRPDLIHAALWDAVVPTQIAASVTRTPVLVTWAAVGNAADHLGDLGWKHRVIRQIDRGLALASNTHFHAVTGGVASANGRALGVRLDRVTVVHRGRPDVLRHAVDGSRLRAELGLPPDAPVVLAVGRQEPIKDHSTLVEAIAELRCSVPDVQLVIAGREGAGTGLLTRAISENHLDDAVHLLGHRDDVDDLLGAADVFVSSSRSEGAAGSVIEAMGAAVPVVTTDVVGLRGLLADGENARVVPVGDPDAMSAAIGAILGDLGLASRLGRAGRRTYESTFRLDASAAGMADLYRSVAATGRSRSRNRSAGRSTVT